MFFNARSIINKLDLLKATICDLNPDLVGITESWATGNILDAELSLDGYQMFRWDRSTGNRGGGVLLYVRDSIKATEFHIDSEFGDHVWCLIGDLLFGIIYRSINSQIVGLDSNKNLLKLLREVSSKHVLILGDFNYPEIDWSTYSALPSASQDCCELISTVEDCFFCQHVTMPTRGASILDLVLSKEPDLVSNVQIISSLGRSDHNMVMFTVHLHCRQFTNNRILRNYKLGDYDSINSVLASVDWYQLLQDTTAGCWKSFIDLLHGLEEQYVPLKRSLRQSDKRKPVWMTFKALKCTK